MMKSPSPNDNLPQTLQNLRQIGRQINGSRGDPKFDSDDVLRLVAESSIQLIPLSAAVIYRIDHLTGDFQLGSRVYATSQPDVLELSAQVQDPPNDLPRPNGLGSQAVQMRRSVLSDELPYMEVHPYHQRRGVHSAVCFPMIVADTILGVLYVYLYENRKFTEIELVTLEVYVNHAAMALFHSRRLDALRLDLEQKEKEVYRIQKATSLLFSRLRLDDTLNAILAMALDLTGAHYGIFRLVDEPKKNLVTRAFSGMNMHRPKTESLPINDESIMGRVALTRAPILITDLSKELVDSYYPLDEELQMRSELAIPLINSSGGLEGVLNLESPLVGGFSQNDALLIQSLATPAVIAIQEFRLLEFFIEIAQTIFKASKTQTLLFLVRMTNQLLNSRLCEVWEFDNSILSLEASSSSTATERVYQNVGIESDKFGQVGDLVNFPCHELVKDYAQNKRVLLSNSLFMWIHQPDIRPRLLVVCASARESSPHPLRNDWNIRILNFIRSYLIIAIQNDQRNHRLQVEQEQRMLAETFAAIGDIASNILHHVNNKVGLIPVKVQSLREKRKDLLISDAYLQRNLNDIEKFALDAMSTVSKNLSNLRPITTSGVNVDKVIAESVAALESHEGLSVIRSIESNLPEVEATEQSLQFIFSNILDNAVEAMNHKGIIEIKGSRVIDGVMISISDNGPGISEDMQKRIFDFENRDASRKRNLGFGLWWVKTILFRIGGSIELKSKPGLGTTFFLKFPAKQIEIGLINENIE